MSNSKLNATLDELIGSTRRVRVHIEGRKMAIPGVVRKGSDGSFHLETNWGLELPLGGENKVTKVEAKDLSSGRFVEIKPARQSRQTAQVES